MNIMDRENVDPFTGALSGRSCTANGPALPSKQLPSNSMFAMIGQRRPLADVTELYRQQVGAIANLHR